MSLLAPSDFLPQEDFLKQRHTILDNVKIIKKARRIPLGPDITFYFENKETILWQIQEMLRIEKGGHEQIQDEIDAYDALVPQKGEHEYKHISCTMMIEENEVMRRKVLLQELSNIENSISLHVGDVIIQAQNIQDGIERTNSQGKTSAIHFLKFIFENSIIDIFKNPQSCVKLISNHPRYSYTHLLSEDQKNALLKDLNSIQ